MTSDVSTRLALETGWRRLDRRMLLVHPANELLRFLPAIIGVSVVGHGDGWWQLLSVGVPVLLGLLRYATTRFRVVGDQLELRHGLVQRRLLTTRLDRVRTVELSASPIHRLLGLVTVELRTGAQDGDALKLDALGRAEAHRMRQELLHREAARPDGAPVADRSAEAARDEVLLRLDPAWVRYAPLSTSTFLVALGAAAAASQSAGSILDRLFHAADLGVLRSASASLLVLLGLAAAAVVVAVAGMVGYLLVNWGFVLSRDLQGRSYHVRRGLLTTRETSLDAARLRGVELREPLGLRLAGAAELAAVATGLDKRSTTGSGSALVVPPAPRGASVQVGAMLLGAAEPLTLLPTRHGRAATRRRWTRAYGYGVPLAAAYGVGAWLLGLHLLAVLGVVLALAACAGLAADRARRLGHALTPEHLVLRTHSLAGCRTVLDRSAVIGWNLRQSPFQRRAGLVTMVATTAAGRQRYRLPDVPEAAAARLVGEVCGEPVAPFLSARPR
ncbi:MAG: PH domain-containing protein [Marmoricola sp.]